MKYFFVLLLLVFISNAQPCKSSTGGGRITQTMTVNGVNREYQMFVPAGMSYPVVAWHGIDSSPADIESKMKMTPFAESEKFILVFPEAKNKGSGSLLSPVCFNGASCCNDDSTFADVSFFTSIKSKLVSDGCVVPSRVFSLGYSNGGFMTHRIACESANSGSNLVAAAALHSGAHGDYDGVYANGPWNSCNSATHIPVIGFHGTSDKTVPFNGGKNPSPWGTAVWGSFYQTMGIWSAQNQCGTPTSVEYTDEGQRVNKTTWTNCPVESHSILGLGHSWWGPSTAKIVTFFKAAGL